MVILALLMLIAAALMVIAAIYGGSDSVALDLGAFDLSTNATGMFFLGMVSLLLFVLSIGTFRAGAKRASSRRKERKKVGELSKQLDAYKRDETSDTADNGQDRA